MTLKLLASATLAFVAGVCVFNFMMQPGSDVGTNLLSVEGECDLSHSPCLAQDALLGHQVSFGLSPRPVPLLKDVAIDATVTGIDGIRVAQVTVEGLNMYMGVQIIPLTVAGTEGGSEQKLTGILQLPVCTSRTMEWGATLVIQTNTEQYKVTYPFTTIVP